MSANDSDKRKTQARAVRPRRRSVVLRPILDAIVAGTVFLFLTCLTSSAPVRACPFSAAFAGIEHSIKPSTLKAVGEPGPAPIIEIATTSSAWDSNAVFRRTAIRRHGACSGCRSRFSRRWIWLFSGTYGASTPCRGAATPNCSRLIRNPRLHALLNCLNVVCRSDGK